MSETDEDTRTRRAGGPLRVASVVLLVLAVVFAGVSGVRLLGADDVRAADATARDEALRAAKSIVGQFNTFDYRNAPAAMDGWLAQSTGDLHDLLETDKDVTVKNLAAGRTVTRGEVVDAALTELDADRGAAGFIASVLTAVTPEGGAESSKRIRMQGTLTRTDQGWLLSSLDLVKIQTA